MESKEKSKLRVLSKRNSFLSESVERLLNLAAAPNTSSSTSLLSANYINIDVETLEFDFNGELRPTTFDDVLESLFPLWQYLCDLHTCLDDKKIERVTNLVRWSGLADEIMYCIDLLKSGDKLALVHSVQILSTILERLMGNVFVTISPNKPCPAMIKDLLGKHELQDSLGEDLILLLNLIIGPPTSLNLRNIIWHGFIKPRQLKQIHANIFLLTLINVCMKINGIIKPVTLRPFLTPPLIPEGPDTSIEVDVKKLGQTFIQPSCIEHIEYALKLYKEGKYGHAAAVIIPQIELILRLLFCWSNSCSERITTAEAGVLFTTLDEILAAELPSPTDDERGIKRNEIFNILHISSVHLIFDMFVLPHGPRLRDKLSHGEYSVSHISKEYADVCFGLVSHILLTHFSVNPVQSTTNYITETYIPRYHPISQLIHVRLLNLCKSLDKIHGMIEEELNNKSPQMADHKAMIADSCCSNYLDEIIMISPIETLITDIISKTVFKYLFRPKIEMTLVRCIRQTLQNLTKLLDDFHTIFLKRRSDQMLGVLRSRQRKNTEHMDNFIRYLILYSKFIAMEICIHTLIKIQKSEDLNTPLLHKMLKLILKYTENLVSTVNTNKWLEAEELIKQLFYKLKHDY